MSISDRGIHPDLLEEEQVAQAEQPAPEPQERARGRSRSQRTQPPVEAQPPVGVSAGGPDAGAASPETTAPAEGESPPSEPEAPEWFAQVRDAKDPSEALKLLAKNLPSEQLSRDETLSGLIGQMGERRARDLVRQQEIERQEKAKRDAAQKGDLYALGELAAPEILDRVRAEAAAGASAPFMDGIASFQKTLPESIQREVAGRTFGAGKGYAEGVQEYVSFIVDEAVKLGVERELKRRESALRKSVMSEVNGEEPVPERDGGTPGRVREVTDEQIAVMSLAEYDALFDENGHPKPGVRHRSTRGIPVRQH